MQRSKGCYVIAENSFHKLVTQSCVTRRTALRYHYGSSAVCRPPNNDNSNFQSNHPNSDQRLFCTRYTGLENSLSVLENEGCNGWTSLLQGNKSLFSTMSAPTSSNNNTNSNYNNARKQRGQSRSKKQQYKKLVKDSKNLLDNLHKIKSVTKQSKELVELIHAWNTLWGPSSTSSSSGIMSRKNSSALLVTYESVDLADKLIHKLLDVLETMIVENQKVNTSVQVPAVMCVLAWERVEPMQNTGVRAERLLNRIIQMQDLAQTKNVASPVRVNTMIYGAVISAWSNSVDSKDGDRIINGGQKAETILNRMKNQTEGSKGDVKPNLIIYNTCLHGYARRGMLSEAEALLETLEKHCENNSDDTAGSNEDSSMSPDVYTYTIMMNAYEKFRGKTNGMPVEKRAEKLLSKMIEKYERTGDRRFMPNQYTIGTVLSIFAKSRSPSGAADADRVLHWLIDSYQKDSELQIQPRVEHFITVFLGYSRRPDKKKACDRIGELLVEMEQLHDSGLLQVRPNYQCFVIYLDNLVKSNEENIEEKVDAILSRMEEMYLDSKDSEFVMNNYGYNLLMNSIVKGRKHGRVERIEAVMERMNNLFKKTENMTLLPDFVSQTCLIKAYTRDKVPGYAEKCKSILKYMEDESSNGRSNLKPDKQVYASVVHAVSIEGYPEECEKLVEDMETLGRKDPDLYPSIQCYNALMSSYGRRRRKDSASNALRIFEKVRKAQIAGNTELKPTNVSYAVCIDALARSTDRNKVEKAEELMDELLKLYRSTEEDNLRPTASIWCSLLLVYAESKMLKKAERALQIINRMQKEGVTCDIVTFNTLLKACAKTNNFDESTRLQVLDISKYAFSEIQKRSDLKPDILTFDSLLWISDKFIVDVEEKSATIKALFKSCCNEGQVGDATISTLMRIASKDIIEDLLGIDLTNKQRVSIADLPKEWSRYRHRFRYRPKM